jgi:hypothetical protein
MTLSLWKRESERATEATGAEDQCDASAVRQVWGRVNSDPLRLELRMFVRVFGGVRRRREDVVQTRLSSGECTCRLPN